MCKILLWLGVALYIVGVALILANVVMYYKGFNTSFEPNNPTLYFFRITRFWHLGLGITVLGGALLMLWRRTRAGSSKSR
jgi:peptidoglycan/LPS O-acetylase OafA/YrhL